MNNNNNYSNFLKSVEKTYLSKVNKKFKIDDNTYRSFIKERSSSLDINNYKIIKDHTLEEYFNNYQKYLGSNIIILDSDELWLMNPKKEYWEIKNDSKALYFEVPTKTLMFMNPYGCALTAFLLVAGIVAGVLCGALLKGNNPGIVRDPWYLKDNWWEYCSNGNPSEEAINDDIGKTVNVTTTDGITYDVRLIGIDHDKLTSSTSNEKAHCTFEFVQLISDSSGSPVLKEYNNTTSDPYYNIWNDGSQSCELRDWLINIFSAILPNNLMSAIKNVKKPTTKGNNDSTVIEQDENLFALSFTEIAGGVYVSAGVEGNSYSYYEEIGNRDPSEKRIKKSIDNTGQNYWLRSPVTNGSVNTWIAYWNGSLSDVDCTEDNFGVAPAFCI